MIAEPKSRAGRMSVALPAALVTELREHQEAQAKERVLAGSLWRGGNWVFASEVGGGLPRLGGTASGRGPAGCPTCTTLGTRPRLCSW